MATPPQLQNIPPLPAIFAAAADLSCVGFRLRQKKLPRPAVTPDKQTVLGLYLKSKDAYALWQKNPQTVKIIDCRTPEEYVFVGHPPMAYNIPGKIHDLQMGRCQEKLPYGG